MDKIIKIYIISIDLLSNTERSIDCNRFEELLGVGMHRFVILNNKDLNCVYQSVQKSIPDSDTTYNKEGFDTRARIFISHHSGRVDSLCINATQYYIYNGKPMKFPNNDVVYFVDSLNHSIKK